jgi:maleate cis-trans isomerase
VSTRTSAPVVGLLYPGFGAEDDFPALERRLDGRVLLPLVHTSVGIDAHAVDALLDLGNTERLSAGARDLARFDPDGVMWACTSGSFVFGWDGARRQVDAVAEQIGRPVSSTSLAFVAAVAALGLERVAVAASYPADVAEAFRRFLARGGLSVTALASHDIFTAAAVGELGPDQVVALVAGVDRTGADAVLVPDTAMHTLAIVDRLEAETGLPVLTANQVTVWEGLRLAGAHRQIGELTGVGLGRLFGSSVADASR